MLVQTPEIQYHGKNQNSEPIYSIHVQPTQPQLKNGKKTVRIATGGVSEVRIWFVHTTTTTSGVQLEFRATLERHEDAINVVRFSPDGTVLASGDAGGVIILWKLVNENTRDPKQIAAEDIGLVNLETWSSYRTFRHSMELTDLAWSPDGKFIMSTSVDASSHIYDVEKETKWKTISDAKHFILGVSWHPKSRYVATLSADKALRIYNPFSENNLPLQKVTHFSRGEANEMMFIGEDNCMARRRLDFSPDGRLLVVPSGAVKKDPQEEGGKRIACSFVFDMDNKKIGNPVAILPSPGATCLVRFCPTLFHHRDTNSVPSEGETTERKQSLLPDRALYRMIYAVASTKQVLLYDTEMERPFALIECIHALELSDLAWTPDGRILMISSLDGYCTFVEFVSGELGEVYVASTSH